ncbi:MAG: hypothetical protein ABI759_26495 [Candidatus Solibacter sp.]
MTKTLRSPFNHEVGGKVEGCTILEKRVVIPPNPDEKRRGIYDYVVEVPPTPAGVSGRQASTRTARSKPAPEPKEGSAGFTRATPSEMGGVIRRIGSR